MKYETRAIPDIDPLDKRDAAILLALVAVALLIRLAFFRGLATVDDFNYLRHAAELWRGQFSLEDVLYLHGTRALVFVPVSWLFGVFGPSETAAALWPLAASLATIALVYLIARAMFGRECAVYAAFAAAILPLMVEESTRILPGSIMNAIIALSVYAFLASEGPLRRRAAWLFISGAAYGAMPLTGELGLLFGVFYPLAIVIFGRHRFWSYWPVMAGFVAVAGCTVLYQWFATGDPFFKAAISKTILETEVPPLRPFFYVEMLVRPFVAHGGVLYLAGVGAVAAACSRDRRALALSAWFVATWLLIEYVSSSLTEYRPLYKYVRYASILSVPGVLLSGFGLVWLRRWVDRAARYEWRFVPGGVSVALVLVILAATSLHTLRLRGVRVALMHSQLDTLRERVRAVDGRTVYVTHWLWNTRVGYFMDFRDDYFPSGYDPYHAVRLASADARSKNRYVQSLAPGQEMAPGLLVHDESLLAASRGERHDHFVTAGEIPALLAEPPPEWRLIQRLDVGRHELVLYEIPPGARWPGDD